VALARRFSPHPVWAALLFVAVPAFVVERQFARNRPPVPGLVDGRHRAVRVAQALALPLSPSCLALGRPHAYQAILLTPILAVYVFLFHRRSLARWLILLIPPLTVAAWQLFERLSTAFCPRPYSTAI